jgi:hypothetical protein
MKIDDALLAGAASGQISHIHQLEACRTWNAERAAEAEALGKKADMLRHLRNVGEIDRKIRSLVRFADHQACCEHFTGDE